MCDVHRAVFYRNGYGSEGGREIAVPCSTSNRYLHQKHLSKSLQHMNRFSGDHKVIEEEKSGERGTRSWFALQFERFPCRGLKATIFRPKRATL